MGCNTFLTGEDERMIEDSFRGGNSNPDMEILEDCKPLIEEAKVEVEEIEKKIEKIIPPYAAPILTQLAVEIRIIPEVPPPEVKDSQVIEKISSFNPKDLLLIEGKNGNFRDPVTENEKYYPKSVPRVEETNALGKRIIPTVENLLKMLSGNAPLDERGDPLEIHHWEQKSERLILMKSEEHRGKGLTKLLHDNQNPLDPKERRIFENKQKPNYYKWKSEKYLGDYTKFFKQLDIKDGKIVKESEY